MSEEFRVPEEPVTIPKIQCKKMTKSVNNKNKTYKKRSGTSGIQGHLYETKLLSLIYFRAINDDKIEEFHLATNVDDLGSFDDICFRAKVKNIDKPLSVFIQAKHRENDSMLTLNSKSELVKHFKSYLDTKNKFNEKKKDVLFDGTYSETECFFVIYTTAKGDQAAPKAQGTSATFLNSLIGTEVSGSGLQPLTDNSKTELNQTLLEEEMLELARVMAKCIHGKFKDMNMLMQEELVLRYHVVLAQQVFDVSQDQSGVLRDARFRKDFFDVKEGLVQLFKEELCAEVLKGQTFASSTSSCLRNYSSCCGVTDTVDEYQEIKHLITYKSHKFEFLDKTGSESYKPFLDKINESQDTIRRTVEIAVKQSLPSLQFRVPASFGNTDLTLRGDDDKKESRLIDLSSKLVGLIKQLKDSNIVKLDESVGETLGEGFLKLNGGIASAVGNLLVLDDDTKLLKFNSNYRSLGKLAKKLFDKLNCEIENLYEYKFDVRVKMFPKLSFDPDEYTKNVVSDFSKKFLFYTSQAKEDKVEKMVINVIKTNLYSHGDLHTKNTKANTIFLKYHDAIQKWWMKKEGEYLTEEGSLYRNAEKDALSQPLVTFINMMQRINNKNYAFTEDAVNSIKLDDQLSGTVIVTKNIALTVAKLINHLIKNDCVVLDMKYILSLSRYDDELLQTELTDLKKENTLIVACDKAIFDTSSDIHRISEVTKSLRSETTIIILNDPDSVKDAKKYFTLKDNVITDERNSLVDMSEETQNSILENTNVIFQGVKMSSKQVLDDAPLGLVGELVLYKLMQNDTNVIGKPACQLSEKGKLYIKRSVKCLKVVNQALDTNDRKVEEGEIKSISTLYDLGEDVVLVIGDPGMGKSTLLTQLSLKTKEVYETVWILRINLLEYSKQFCEWQDNKTVIDNLKSLKFLCQVALSEGNIKKNDVQITLEELNGTVSLKYCDGDEWTVFELKMFLHYYNTKQLIILFDGFDEICPTYVREVLSLIEAVMNLRQKHKIWIASRSYDKIVTELDIQILYKMEPLDNDDQDLYLSTFWEEKNLLNKIHQKSVRNNLRDFSRFMSKSDDLHMFKKKSHLPDESITEKPMLAVYLSLFKYLKPSLKYLGCKDLYKEPASQFNGLAATPLHLNMLSEHLCNKIDGKGANDDLDHPKTNPNERKPTREKLIEAETELLENMVGEDANNDHKLKEQNSAKDKCKEVSPPTGITLDHPKANPNEREPTGEKSIETEKAQRLELLENMVGEDANNDHTLKEQNSAKDISPPTGITLDHPKANPNDREPTGEKFIETEKAQRLELLENMVGKDANNDHTLKEQNSAKDKCKEVSPPIGITLDHPKDNPNEREPVTETSVEAEKARRRRQELLEIMIEKNDNNDNKLNERNSAIGKCKEASPPLRVTISEDMLPSLPESILKVWVSRGAKINVIPRHTLAQQESDIDVSKIDVIEENDVDDNHVAIKWDLDVNLFEIYEHFLEYKLKIRFEGKNQTDRYKPDNREQYKRELADTKDKLKKLAAYVVYNKRLLDKHELKRCEEIIDNLKEGEEKTDIICNVVNDMPIFVHSTFAEYFAIEYICNLIRSQRNLKNIYNFILNVMFFKQNKNILVIFDAKIKSDNQLTSIIQKNKGIIFRLLLEQGKITKNKHACIKSSLCEAIRLGLRNLAFLLLSTSEEYLYEGNLMDFIEIVKETNMLMIAVKMGFDELIIEIVNRVRMIRESKLNALLENIEIFDKNDNLAGESTSELVQKLHANVWTRMDIIPDWENLRELGGQIYFI